MEEVGRLAGREREATVAFIVHLAEFDARALYAEAGFSSTYRYCLEALHLSEDAAWNRIEAARMARAYPMVLDMLSEGRLSPTTARMVRPHLTAENHAELLEAAAGKSKREVEKLLACLFPQPDVEASVRAVTVKPVPPAPRVARKAVLDPSQPPALGELPARLMALPMAAPRPVLRPLSADGYEIRFTAPVETHDKLRRAQDLLAGSVPSGDLAQVIDRALTLLVADLERKKAALTARPQDERSRTRRDSRHIPASVRRQVWTRDGGRCAFVAEGGRPCGETRHLEFHHGPVPYAFGGKATAGNIRLLCRAHNRHEAERFYGPGREYGGIDLAREAARESALVRARGSADLPVPERVEAAGSPM